MSRESFKPGLQNIIEHSPKPKDDEGGFSSVEAAKISEIPVSEPEVERVERKIDEEKPSFLETLPIVSKEQLSESVQLIANQTEKISNKDATELLVNLMKRFMVEQSNEAVVANQSDTKLSEQFAEFQSAEDIGRQTQRYMVEMLVDEWVRATGRRLVDPESSREVSDAIRTIRGDMQVGWFKRMFRGKLSETEIIKSMEVLQLQLNEMREKLNQAKMKEAEIAKESAEIIRKAKAEAEEIENKAKLEEKRLRAIIADLKADPNVVKVYNEKFSVNEIKEGEIEKFRREVMKSMSYVWFKRQAIEEKFDNILDNCKNLTIREKNKILRDLWEEYDGRKNIKFYKDSMYFDNHSPKRRNYFWEVFNFYINTYREQE